MRVKKKILFVIPGLDAGGAEKSLVNLLNQIDFDSYEVDLFLFKKGGLFMKSLPLEVNILSHSETFEKFNSGLIDACSYFLSRGKIGLFISRFQFFIKNRCYKNNAVAEQQSWKYFSKSIPNLEKEYDAAIGFLEKSSVYFVIDIVKSKNKIGWVHTNYATSGMDSEFDTYYFDKLNHLVTVSDECAASLRHFFSTLSNRIKVIENIISPKIINNLATVDKDNVLEDKNINLLTIGRLSPEKGIDLAVETTFELVKRYPNLKWFVIGEGTERIQLEQKIKESELEDSFFLLGLKENPYPYLKQCDIYVQPSRYEGKSIAVDEAKILGKPIILTNFTTAKDQINSGLNGLITEMNPEAVAKAVEYLIENKNVVEDFVSNLSLEKLGTEEEINKLYCLMINA
ncbi:glycosyltransferase [Flavobacterium sp. MAHUQ-51]|uniref:glycosyltransferase n=1 Tax=Flavobacterium sp. GCM10022190 TaxID=3252639 RepID=UPI00362309DA